MQILVVNFNLDGLPTRPYEYLRSDVFAAVGSTRGLVNISVRRFGMLEGPTRVTSGLAQPAGV